MQPAGGCLGQGSALEAALEAWGRDTVLRVWIDSGSDPFMVAAVPWRVSQHTDVSVSREEWKGIAHVASKKD